MGTWSIWQQRLAEDRADLVVVGAGITGLFAALFHQRAHPGHRVRVLDQGAYPMGATVRNAGFACFGSPSELLADMAREGADVALARVEERWKGLLELRHELGDAAIGFEPVGGHEVYGCDDPLYTRVAEGFDALNEALHPIFGRKVFHWEEAVEHHFGAGTQRALACTPLEGALDSAALMRTLLAKVREAGVELHWGTRVQAWEERSDAVELCLHGGERIRAEQVLLATNGYTEQLGLDLVRPARGQVLITDTIPGLRLRGTFHAHEGFYYFRHLDGAVLLGGGRHLDVAGETTTEDGLSPHIQQDLERFLAEVVLPDTPHRIAHRWSGIMGFPQHGKEVVVRRLGERVRLAAGLSGMGVAIGIRVARRAVDL